MGTRIRFERVLAVMGAAALIVFATDALTYAATGSSLILGRNNSANTSTTLTNTGSGPALKLITKSATAAPFTVNGKGKVINLYAARAGLADTATNATKLGGRTLAQVNAASAPRVANVRWVAKSGGQYTSVKAALASITNNSSANRYLISIAPGTYTETGGITLKPYVDIVGAGQDLTTITCACTSAGPISDPVAAAVRGTGALHATVSDLTVQNTGTSFATGVLLNSVPASSFTLDHVAVFVNSSASATTATGVLDVASAPRISDLHVVVTGLTTAGIRNMTGSTPDLDGVRIETSSVGGVAAGVYNTNSSGVTSRGLRINATTDLSAQGIINDSSNSNFVDSVVHITGSGFAIAVNDSSSTSTYTGGEFTGEGAFGVDVFEVSGGNPVINGVVAAGGGGTTSSAIHLFSGSVTVRNSTLSGATGTVVANSGTVLVTGSVLDSVSGTAAFVCALDVNSSGATLNATCA